MCSSPSEDSPRSHALLAASLNLHPGTILLEPLHLPKGKFLGVVTAVLFKVNK